MRPERRKLIAAALAAATILAVQAPVATGTLPPPGGWDVRLWMLPPVDLLGNKACLSNHWHGTEYDYHRALDWKAGNAADTNCTFSASELVRFRAMGASIEESNDGTYWSAMYGVQQNLNPITCGGELENIGKVKLYAIGLGTTLRGSMYYVHSILYSGQFNLQFKRGSSRSNAYLNSIGIGNTTQDGPSGCWTGWHVHENNSDDATMYWDGWNTTKWANASLLTNSWVTDDDVNWVRQMTTAISIGE